PPAFPSACFWTAPAASFTPDCPSKPSQCWTTLRMNINEQGCKMAFFAEHPEFFGIIQTILAFAFWGIIRGNSEDYGCPLRRRNADQGEDRPQHGRGIRRRLP